MTVLLAALTAFPAAVDSGPSVISASVALGGIIAQAPDDSDHSDQTDHSPDDSDHSDQTDHSPDDSDHSDQTDHSPDDSDHSDQTDHSPDDSDHSDQTDHSPDDSDHSDQTDHSPDDSDHSDQTDHSPDDSQLGGVIDQVIDVASVFDQLAVGLLEVAAGELSVQLSLALADGTSTVVATIRQAAATELAAELAVKSTHSASEVGDLVRLLPVDLVMVPSAPGSVAVRSEVHFLRSDGEVVSGQLTGRIGFGAERSLPGHVLVTHRFSPARLSQHPVSIQAVGVARSLTVSGQ